MECIEKTHQRLQQALQAAAEHKQRADSNHRALEDSRQQLRHFEKLLRGRSDDLNLAVESERSMQMQVSEAEERAKTLVRELADEQRRSEYLAQQLSSPKEKSAHGHCLGSELEMERNSHLALQARNKKLEAEVGELKRRCSALEVRLVGRTIESRTIKPPDPEPPRAVCPGL